MDHGLENLVDPDAHFRAAIDRLLGGDGEDFLELAMHRRQVSIRQIDLVDDRDDRQACFGARWTLATVWASTPWAASTIRTAPSQAARLRETS